MDEIYQGISLIYITFMGWYFVSYLIPYISEKLNRFYYENLFINNYNENDNYNIQSRLEKVETEYELNYLSLIKSNSKIKEDLDKSFKKNEKLEEKLTDLENKLNYLDHSYKRDYNILRSLGYNNKDNFNNLDLRLNKLEKMINNCVIIPNQS